MNIVNGNGNGNFSKALRMVIGILVSIVTGISLVVTLWIAPLKEMTLDLKAKVEIILGLANERTIELRNINRRLDNLEQQQKR